MGTWAHPEISKSWGTGERALEGWIGRFPEEIKKQLPGLGGCGIGDCAAAEYLCLRARGDGLVDLVSTPCWQAFTWIDVCLHGARGLYLSGRALGLFI